jgi:glycosyltransferase involved in cell wall biosynthesis
MIGMSDRVDMLTIADLCPYWSWPPTGGGPLRVHFLNKSLSKNFKILQFSARPTFGHQRSGFSNWVGSRTLEVNRNYLEYQYFHPLILLTGYILYKMSLHSDIFLSQTLKMLSPRILHEIVNQASIIQVEHPWMFNIAYHLARGKPVVYVAHNIESDLWEPLAHNNQTLFPYMTSRPRKLEGKALTNATSIVAMSQKDADRIEKIYRVNSKQIYIIPNGADLESRSPPTFEEKVKVKQRLKLEGRSVVLFMGSDHYPNKEALSYIQRWQRNNKSRFNSQFLVVGTVSRGIPSTPHMRIEGHVPDVSDYLRAADIAINPITTGSGTSLKVVEYLACGLPTISTDLGIRGLDLVPGWDILIGEIPEFPELIIRLLQDPSLQKKLALNGRRTVEQRYGWDQLGGLMQNVYNNLPA